MVNNLSLSPTTAGVGSTEVDDRPAEYEGILQGIGDGVVLGWVADLAHPDASVPVSLVVDGELVAEGIADVMRADLMNRDLGDGAHGFLIALPERLQTPGRRRILALAGHEQVPIAAAPSFWHKPAADGTWSHVVFEPGGALSAQVPSPPATAGRRAIVSADWLLDADEELVQGLITNEDVERALARLTAADRACAELGIAYLPALVPCKRAVLESSAAQQPDGLMLLHAGLRDLDGVELVDLLGVLRDCARHGPPYHRTDADWNDRGAFFVARALLKEAGKRTRALSPPTLSDLHLRPVPAYRGTLADVPKFELVGDELMPCDPDVDDEQGIVIDASRLRALRMPVESTLAQAGSTHLRVYSKPEQDEQAHIAVLGDSAALSLVPWLAERTSRTVFLWTQTLPLPQLELELPRVVLHVMRERDLLDR